MEEFSVLRTPAYPKYHGLLSQPHYSDRHGYAITYYEPIYDVDLKIPGLGIAEFPFVPIQHIRSNRSRRPFVPRHLTEEDMIQINLRATRKAKDIMKDFHPAQKASYESLRDFRTKKEIESRMDDIRESCANVHNYYRKAAKYDFTRDKLFNPKSTVRFEDKDTLKDIILESNVDHINDIKVKLGEDNNNHRERFRMLSAGCKKEVKEEKIATDSVDADEPLKSSSRRTSRDVRADQLKELQERIKNQESASDCFERTFGRHLSKLRGEVNDLTNLTDGFIGDTRYRSFKAHQVTGRF
ncbi:CLUMA_CG000089, isoform A [Clunio marinus]|uniref:CLUMA_CG000089, isoform A n=1 Tax=Clunio marinus TaxID=568069 RepID=A0A1J1HEG9_9DIPT|nr:CLUMA_CG000089, isoform A [Clunio marinus]